MSKTVVVSIILIMIAVLSLSIAWYRPNAIVEAPVLPMNFGHADHQAIECTTCHHNFIDDTGTGLCVDCHKRSAEVAHLIEEQFHTLCRDCHAEHAQLGEETGPLRVCLDCHKVDSKP